MTGVEAMAAVPHLPLCSACFKEVLRLKPPIDELLLEPTAKAVTLSNGVEIRLGDEVWVDVSILGQDPTTFPDPLEFKPSRWLEASEKLDDMNAAFTAFGYGPRVCPGKVIYMLRLSTSAIVRTNNGLINLNGSILIMERLFGINNCFDCFEKVFIIEETIIGNKKDDNTKIIDFHIFRLWHTQRGYLY
jgi:hypothetical protein